VLGASALPLPWKHRPARIFASTEPAFEQKTIDRHFVYCFVLSCDTRELTTRLIHFFHRVPGFVWRFAIDSLVGVCKSIVTPPACHYTNTVHYLTCLQYIFTRLSTATSHVPCVLTHLSLPGLLLSWTALVSHGKPGIAERADASSSSQCATTTERTCSNGASCEQDCLAVSHFSE